MGAAAARQIARELIGDVARGRDPQAERRTERRCHVRQLHSRYVEEHAKRHNKSWKQADELIKRHVLPNWANLSAKEINRSQVKALIGSVSVRAPILRGDAVRLAVSAVFTFGVKEEVVTINPCKGVDDNPTTSRDRTLSKAELPSFWAACEAIDPVKAAALKVVLLTGQRPGEVRHMRWEHIKGSWWEMPGKPGAGARLARH